jgi:hypothetical protein
MATSKSENYVINLISSRFGVLLEKIPDQQTTPSPDFVFRLEDKTVFVAELKDIDCDLPSEGRGWTIPKLGEPNYPWSFREDNAVNRVAAKIHEAYKQLISSPSPRVLIILNHDFLVDVKDLQEAYEGRLLYSSDAFSYYNVASKKIADGRIKHRAHLVSLSNTMWFRSRSQYIQTKRSSSKWAVFPPNPVVKLTNERAALSTACCGFMFLLLRFLYLMTLVFVNFASSMNSSRLVHFEDLQCGRLVHIR